MAEIQWGLGAGNNALQYFQLGQQLGNQVRERRDESQRKNALAAYATNPNDPASLAGVIQADPRLGIQLQGQQAERTQAQQTQRRADLPLIGRLLDSAKDEASYQNARSVAQQYGIDVSQLPPSFDPAWVQQQKATIQMLGDPKAQEALSTAGKIAVDQGFKPGTPEFNNVVRQIWQAQEAKPYVSGGETRLYQPQIGGPGQAIGGPQPGAVEDGYRFKGGNPGDPASWEPVGQGGPAAAPQTPFEQAFLTP